VTLYGCGFIGGSLSGSRGGSYELLLRRYLAGALLMALGFLTSGLAPSVVAALVTFLAAGYGNGLLLVYERQLIQALVPDVLAGRVFGIRDAITAWAFAVGFVVGPLLIDGLGTRVLIVGAGACGLIVWIVAVLGFRRQVRSSAQEELAGGSGAELAWNRSSSKHGADPIGS
jgi:MFS family permease